MLKFNIVEFVNKIIGIIIMALITRILSKAEFDIYLYYQTVFGQLLIFSIFSTDYKLLISYQIDKEYIKSNSFYTILNYRTLFTCISVILSITLLNQSDTIAFWPFLFSILSCLFLFDSILYVENSKNSLIYLRLLSQIISASLLLFYYFKIFSSYYIAFIQVSQTIILTAGTFLIANKYLNISILKLLQFREWNFKIFKELLQFFIIRNFIGFICSIELILFSKFQLQSYRNIFAEGLRLSIILAPFAIFYIRFNLKNLNKMYFTFIQISSIVLLFLSPFYILLLFGIGYIKDIFYYNFFIIVFIFNSFIESDYAEVLIENKINSKKLSELNIVYFVLSTVILLILVLLKLSLTIIISFFIIKLVIYYFIFCKKITHHYSSFYRIILSIILIIGLNYIFEVYDLYNAEFKIILNCKRLLSDLISK